MSPVQVLTVSRRCVQRRLCGSSWPCSTATTILLPHASLRRPVPQPAPTPGKRLRHAGATLHAAMAAGLTDHVWTLREVLLFRVRPWPQPAGV